MHLAPNQTLVTHLPATAVKTFYKVREVAEILDLNYITILRMIHAGEIASIRIHPSNKRSKLRIAKSEVLRLLTPMSHG